MFKGQGDSELGRNSIGQGVIVPISGSFPYSVCGLDSGLFGVSSSVKLEGLNQMMVFDNKKIFISVNKT